MKIIELIKEYIDSQYGNPKGLFGMYIGEKMVRQHRPETLWTIQLLDIKQADAIMEIGCGAGYASKLILQNPAVKLLVGLDKSKSILRSSSIRNRKELSNGRLILRNNDVSQLNCKDMSFHKVFSIHSIYFWKDIQQNIMEVYRVLKPEGMVILTLSDGKNGVTSDWAKDLIENQIIPGMKKCGFRNVEILRGQPSREYNTISIRAKR